MAKTGLLPRPSDRALRDLALERLAEGMHNGVRLGPNSPLIKGKRGRDAVSTKPTNEKSAGSVDTVDPWERMNKWERMRARELAALKATGQIADWGFEVIALILGNRTRYHPDLLVIETSGRIRLEEVKGFMRDDAAVKIKIAARQFPYFTFVLLGRAKGVRHEWVRKEVKR